jgi:aminoglycoside phosphotransferase (APT) family kinase protein
VALAPVSCSLPSADDPEPIGQGRPTGFYPLPWAVYDWIDGQPYTDEIVDEVRAAEDLGRFVVQLRAVDQPPGVPRAGRRPLKELDAVTRTAIESAGEAIDRVAVAVGWDRALRAPVWEGSPVWIHTDLLRPNILIRDGRISAVIDFGGCGVGDPAADVIAAWSVTG